MGFLQGISFKTKLLMLCVFMAAVSVTIGAVSYVNIQRLQGTTSEITDSVLPKIQLTNTMYLEFRRIRIALRTLGITGISKEQQDEAVKTAIDAIDKYESSQKEYLELGFINGQKEAFEKSDAAWKRFKEIGARVLKLQASGHPEDKEEMTKIFFKDCPDAANAYSDAFEDLLEFHERNEVNLVVESKDTAKEANTIVGLVIVIGVLSGLTIGFIFSTVVSRSLTNVVNHLNESADLVSSASTQIAGSSQQLSQASTEQAASLQQTAAAVDELSSMVIKNTENAKNTASSSQESQNKAGEGKEAVERMMQSMEDINRANESIMSQINTSNQQMTEIVKVIQEIGNKTKVINDIVFQTKLLSFNASVEAARAGEHGKGFAVVAEEVGNLAQMSGNAAKEISAMLDGSIQKVEKIVHETKNQVETLIAEGKGKVEMGVEVARQCSDILNEIVTNVANVSSMAGEISSASQEQSQGISEINKAMNQLDQVTQQNASTSNEAASAADTLSTQAESLKNSVDELVHIISGNKASAAAPGKSAVASAPSAKKSNVIPLKKKAKAQPVESQKVFKAASGDDSAPNYNDPGFQDT